MYSLYTSTISITNNNFNILTIHRVTKKERMFLYLPAISFFGVTSNQKSTFVNLVQSTI